MLSHLHEAHTLNDFCVGLLLAAVVFQRALFQAWRAAVLCGYSCVAILARCRVLVLQALDSTIITAQQRAAASAHAEVWLGAGQQQYSCSSTPRDSSSAAGSECGDMTSGETTMQQHADTTLAVA